MKIDTKEKLQLAISKPLGYLRLLSFCEQVEAGQVPDKQLLQDLAAAFRLFIQAQTLEKGQSAFSDAMNLKREAERPKTTEIANRQLIAAFLFAYYQLKGADRDTALEQAANKSDYTERHVDRCYQWHKSDADALARNILKYESDVQAVEDWLQMTKD